MKKLKDIYGLLALDKESANPSFFRNEFHPAIKYVALDQIIKNIDSHQEDILYNLSSIERENAQTGFLGEMIKEYLANIKTNDVLKPK